MARYRNKDTKLAAFFDDLLKKADSYNYFIQPENYDDNNQKKLLIDLKRIGSSPSHLLLLFLYSLDPGCFRNRELCLEAVLSFLVKYYVRRNITDIPNTRDLDAINIEVIESCQKSITSGEKITEKSIIEYLTKGKGKPAEIWEFRDDLEDNLYYFNSGMARYLLAKLDEATHSKEYRPDLWARNEKGLLVWTVEHILPQGTNIPKSWIDMIAKGNKSKAEEIHENWVHCLGNLTLSGYNSQLSNASFKIKQDLHQDKRFLGHKINIGYKNKLSLNSIEFDYLGKNTALATIEEWTEEAIESRNKKLVDTLLKQFAFDERELIGLKDYDEKMFRRDTLDNN